jgi:signal transduction histidine kinase
VAQFLIYSLVIFLVLMGLNYVVTTSLNNAFPVLDDLLEYEDELAHDDFADIPMKRFQGCELLVVDENNETIYTTDFALDEIIEKEDIPLVNDWFETSTYDCYSYTNEEGKKCIVVFQSNYDEELNTLSFSNYCILDEENRIIDGNLFPDKEQLTETELELIRGHYKGSQAVERYQYETVYGEERTLVFFSPLFEYSQYEQQVDQIEQLWLVAIPVILGMIILQSLLFTRKLRASLAPLNQAIVEYVDGRRVDLTATSMPAEFRQVVVNFDHMLDKLETSRQETEQAYQEKQRVLADISHDLKTPLTVIQGYARALADGMVPPDKQEHYIQIISQRAENMSQLMKVLLDYTRLEHPNFQMAREKVDFSEFCRQYLSEKYQEIQLSGFQLELDIPEEPIYIAIDIQLMRRVLENLVGNALNYNPAGTTLYVGLRTEGRTAQLTVADNGIGIPTEIQSNLFEAFVSGNQARTSGGGSGMGLSIVKRIVQLHGGSVELRQPPENGFSAEFVIQLEVLDIM